MKRKFAENKGKIKNLEEIEIEIRKLELLKYNQMKTPVEEFFKSVLFDFDEKTQSLRFDKEIVKSCFESVEITRFDKEVKYESESYSSYNKNFVIKNRSMWIDGSIHELGISFLIFLFLPQFYKDFKILNVSFQIEKNNLIFSMIVNIIDT